jgi:calmodulin
MFDSGKKGSIEKEKVRTILTTLGQTYDDKQLDSLLDGEDPEGKAPIDFFLISICHMTPEPLRPINNEISATFRPHLVTAYFPQS